MIKNEKIYVQNVEEGAETRVEIDVSLRTQLKGLMKTFEAGFLEQGKILKFVNDLAYYKGGYPRENSPAKSDELADTFAKAVTYLRLLGDARIENRLKEVWGITVNVPERVESFNVDKFAESYVKLVSESEKPPMTAKDAFADLIKRGQIIQGQICAASDSIKIERAEKVEEECDVKKSHFMRGVAIRSKAMKKDDDSQVKVEKDKIEEAANALVEALKPIK